MVESTRPKLLANSTTLNLDEKIASIEQLVTAFQAEHQAHAKTITTALTDMHVRLTPWHSLWTWGSGVLGCFFGMVLTGVLWWSWPKPPIPPHVVLFHGTNRILVEHHETLPKKLQTELEAFYKAHNIQTLGEQRKNR